MNTSAGSSLQSTKAFAKHDKGKVELQSSKMIDAERPKTNHRSSRKERKIALQHDVDKLRKRLRHEENVHRALERAFTRPMGALPRLPAYLPPDTLELLAEVAVLEEEVVRLEEKVVHFRQGLYQEAVNMPSSKKNVDNSSNLCDPCQSKDLKPKHSGSFVQTVTNSAAFICKNQSSISDEKRGKENQSSTNSSKNKQELPNSKNKQELPNSKVQTVRIPGRRPSIDCKSADKRLDAQKLQMESRVMDHENSGERNFEGQEELLSLDDSPNKISESILKCLMNIFFRMSSKKRSSVAETLPSLSTPNSLGSFASTEFKDSYGICSKFGKRDIGPYKNLFSIEATSINPNRTTISVFLVQRLNLLLKKVASVDLTSLSHQEKLAFWINIYNSCMMNAFIEYGIPESPDMVVSLMQKATIIVGGQILNAITIEHFILRLPYHSKYTFSKGSKYDEMTIRSIFGLELSEPLVTFALSCGSWSSPAVRVYTGSRVEYELETAKREYLQAAVGISRIKKVLAIPKLLDWYLLDFAKDIESLLDWICLQLPCELGKEAMKCLEMGKDEFLSESLQIIPYDFSFRYLLQP